MYKIIVVLALVGSISAVADSTMVRDGLMYRIVTDKKEYISGEPIVVTAIVSNTSDNVREVRLPTSLDQVVTYSVHNSQKPSKWSSEKDSHSEMDRSWPVVSLNPGKMVQSSVELHFAFFHGSRFLPFSPGVWHLQSRYHFADIDSARYDVDVLVADEVVIQVIEPQGDLKIEHDEFMSAMKDADRKERFRKLSVYIENHKRGLFCLPALEEMERCLWRKGDREGCIRIDRKIRSMKVSSESDDLACLGEAMGLESLGRPEEALQAIDEEATKRCSRLKEYREHLRKKIKELPAKLVPPRDGPSISVPPS